jgi:hypothetical protein
VEQERIYDVPNKSFLDFINTGPSGLKMGSCKYGRDTPLSTSHSIFVVARKYRNRQKKYRNTGRTGQDFIRP